MPALDPWSRKDPGVRSRRCGFLGWEAFALVSLELRGNSQGEWNPHGLFSPRGSFDRINTSPVPSEMIHTYIDIYIHGRTSVLAMDGL